MLSVIEISPVRCPPSRVRPNSPSCEYLDLVSPLRRVLQLIAVAVPGFGWAVPMFTQLYKKYPALGSIFLYPSRVATAVIDGTKREGIFYPHHPNLWDVAPVRNGGPVQLTVRPGFLGIPWVAKFSDP